MERWALRCNGKKHNKVVLNRRKPDMKGAGDQPSVWRAFKLGLRFEKKDCGECERRREANVVRIER